ncbi:hypothetical protein TNIN_2731 [Trichonephila inaurata madagascariensis]|uniref:Uncharacterized protein n=1 Tax=Trichonephila inaurata madagascariensis TaxID=2747483 RepID=A0A8X6YAB4_9ARAC|nr:hypothetical protein TNIN_2731 [Trichonephila inaurata madagascariensis]
MEAAKSKESHMWVQVPKPPLTISYPKVAEDPSVSSSKSSINRKSDWCAWTCYFQWFPALPAVFVPILSYSVHRTKDSTTLCFYYVRST